MWPSLFFIAWGAEGSSVLQVFHHDVCDEVAWDKGLCTLTRAALELREFLAFFPPLHELTRENWDVVGLRLGRYTALQDSFKFHVVRREVGCYFVASLPRRGKWGSRNSPLGVFQLFENLNFFQVFLHLRNQFLSVIGLFLLNDTIH